AGITAPADLPQPEIVPYVVATVGDDLGLGQVCGGGDPGAGVGSVLTWTEHRVALLAQRCGPALYDKRLLGATRCSRYSLFCCRFSHDNKAPVRLNDTPANFSTDGFGLLCDRW